MITVICEADHMGYCSSTSIFFGRSLAKLKVKNVNPRHRQDKIRYGPGADEIEWSLWCYEPSHVAVVTWLSGANNGSLFCFLLRADSNVVN